MKRSQINQAIKDAIRCFNSVHWVLPPQPRWDVTDCGLNDFHQIGLVLVNLTDQPEYCEKIMYARQRQVTPLHAHRRKKEDIICRHGQLSIEFWKDHPDRTPKGAPVLLYRNGEPTEFCSSAPVVLEAGERVTIQPGIYHTFWPVNGEAVIGEISTANDDTNDNFFVNPAIGRFPEILEDEPPLVRLVWEPKA